MYWGKSNENGIGKGQSNKDSIQRVATVNLYELKNSFSTKFGKS